MSASAENTNAENTISKSENIVNKPVIVNFVPKNLEDSDLEYVETKFPAVNKLPPEELLLQTYDESRERFNVYTAPEVENAKKFVEPITVQVQTAKYVRKPTAVTKSCNMMKLIMCFRPLCTKMFGRSHYNITEPIVEPLIGENDYYLHRNEDDSKGEKSKN